MSLGTGAKKGQWGLHASMRHSREVSMAILLAGTSPTSGHQLTPSHINTYLTQCLPGYDFQQGWEGQGSKFVNERM